MQQISFDVVVPLLAIVLFACAIAVVLHLGRRPTKPPGTMIDHEGTMHAVLPEGSAPAEIMPSLLGSPCERCGARLEEHGALRVVWERDSPQST